MSRIIEFSGNLDNRNIFIRSEINIINQEIYSIINSLKKWYTAISQYEVNTQNLDKINIAIVSITKLKEEINSINIDEFDLLFRLKIVEKTASNISNKIINLSCEEEINEVTLFYILNLTKLYKEIVGNILSTRLLDKSNVSNNILVINDIIREKDKLLYMEAKRDVYTSYVIEVVKELFGNYIFSKEEKDLLMLIVNDTIEYFLNFDFQDIREYFSMIILYCSENKIFNHNSKEDFKNKKNELMEKIKSYKLYYSTKESINKLRILFGVPYLKKDDREKIDKSLSNISSFIQKDNDEFNKIINITMKRIEGMVMCLNIDDIEENKSIATLIEEYLCDEMEIDRIIRFISSFEKYCSKKKEAFVFKTEWIKSKKECICDILYDLVRREIFSNEYKEFYCDDKYKSILDDMIKYISENPNYINTRKNNDKLVPDFKLLLELLKKAKILEDKVKALKLNYILEDMDKLDYKNYAYTSEYILGISAIIDSENIENSYYTMKKELSKKRTKKR